eukprot:m.329093 g.329093  ORF g.329093 m.329093 type:complete len:89 (+) comp20439_c0_seq22:146-412(+)
MEDIIDAAQRGDARTIRDILDRDPTVISVQDDKGYSAHHWSAYADDGDVLEVLLQYDHKGTEVILLLFLLGYRIDVIRVCTWLVCASK